VRSGCRIERFESDLAVIRAAVWRNPPPGTADWNRTLILVAAKALEQRSSSAFPRLRNHLQMQACAPDTSPCTNRGIDRPRHQLRENGSIFSLSIESDAGNSSLDSPGAKVVSDDRPPHAAERPRGW